MRVLTPLLLVALLTACGGDGDAAAPPETTTVEVTTTEPAEPAGPLGDAQTCSNPDGGYSISFPDEWHANSGEVTQPCTFFDPQPVEVPEATEAIGFAISVGRESAPFERVTGESVTNRVLSEERVELAGREGVRMEIEATGEGLLDAGTRTYLYALPVGEETILASTTDVGDLDYERNREVLDAMVETLELDQPAR